LFFIIIRLFKDMILWLFVFVIFAIGFQLAFINITIQAGADPTSGYPGGSFPVSFFTIIGDFTYIEDVMKETPLGIALLGIYALIAQIMLVNLLIAMMGSTYAAVSDNSTEEWKFYRLELVSENQSASFHPPPTNLIMIPFEIYAWIRKSLKKKEERRLAEKEPLVQETSQQLIDSSKGKHVSTSAVVDPVKKHPELGGFDLQKTLKKMRIARDEVISQEELEEATSVESIVTELKDRLRTLTNERENDRTFTEKRFKDLEVCVRQIAPAGAPAGAAASAADLREELAVLHRANQQLAQQNQQILSLLQHLRPPALEVS